MLKALSKLVGLGLGVGILSAVSTYTLFGQEQPEYADNVPLTFTQVTTIAGASNAPASEFVSRGARRADGSLALATYGLDDDGTGSETRLIIDLREAKHVSLDSRTRSVTTAYLSDEEVKQRRRRGVCEGERVPSLLNYEVVRRTSEITYSSGDQLRVETLLAPDLGCLEMQKRTTLISADGDESGVQIERVVDLKLGEPAEAWFIVPSDYVEMSPIEQMQKLHPLADLNNDHFVQTWEANYRARQDR